MKKDKNKIEYISEEDTGAIDKKIKKIKAKLKQCQKEKEEYLAGWQRARADLINYKKEQEQKISDYYKFANQSLITEILMVLDSFEQSLKHKKDDGLLQIYNQLKNTLKNNGLEEIKAIGEKFNPEFHESIGEVKGKKPGFIVEEVQKGYKLNNKVIRPSRVKINK
jgi:molecular chaperone GrpE